MIRTVLITQCDVFRWQHAATAAAVCVFVSQNATLLSNKLRNRWAAAAAAAEAGVMPRLVESDRHPSVPRLMLMADDWLGLLPGCGTRWYLQRRIQSDTLVTHADG